MTINNDIVLLPFHKSDKYMLVRQLNDLTIYKNTLSLPFPYTEKDAALWLENIKLATEAHGRTLTWAIRLRSTGEVVGCIGRLLRYGLTAHKDEIGYWLSRMHRNKGYMTDALKVYTDFLAAEENLIRIEAMVFHYNLPSARALEKAGFEREGYLKKDCMKDKIPTDTILFAKVV
jgi:[ribosomal protein S5]-alanine N-acetyltransferase